MRFLEKLTLGNGRLSNVIPVSKAARESPKPRSVLRSVLANELFTVPHEGRDRAQAAAAHPRVQTDEIKLLSVLRPARDSLVLVADEYGIAQRLVTPHEVPEAIAGEFPDSDETHDIVSDGAGWLFAGGTDLFEFEFEFGDLELDYAFGCWGPRHYWPSNTT